MTGRTTEAELQREIRAQIKPRSDLLLLVSLLLVILLHPLLDHGNVRRMILEGLIFLPIILSLIRVSQIRGWVWSTLLLVGGILIFTIAGKLSPNPAITAIKWGLVAVFFAVTVVGLFSYVRDADSILTPHLFTAVSMYLLLGLLWFALYSSVDCLYPNSILSSQHALADRQSELLYFSLTTLTTLGYGDVVPLYSEVRILAALEAVTGVLYVAITVAIIVSRFRRQSSS